MQLGFVFRILLISLILTVYFSGVNCEKKAAKAGKKTLTNDEFQAMQAEQAKEREEEEEKKRLKKIEKKRLKKEAKKSGKKEPKKKKKRTKDWNKITENDLEKDWEEGDDEEELEHEYDHSQKIAKKVQERKAKESEEEMRKINSVNPNDPDNIQKMLRKKARDARKSGGLDMNSIGGGGIGGMLNGGTGTAMYFTDIVAKVPTGKQKGKEWTKLMLDDLCGKWSSMLRSAHLGANIYSIDATAAEGQVLVAIDKPWQSSDILRYLLHQPEIVKMSKDSKNYTKEMFPQDEDDEL